MADTKDFLGTGWAFPVAPVGGKIRTASAEVDIRQAIQIILATAPGERVMEPEFGCAINELVFAPQNGATQDLIAFYVREALERWEPRIAVETVRAVPDANDAARMSISIDYVIRTKNQRDNLVYPFYLQSR